MTQVFILVSLLRANLVMTNHLKGLIDVYNIWEYQAVLSNESASFIWIFVLFFVEMSRKRASPQNVCSLYTEFGRVLHNGIRFHFISTSWPIEYFDYWETCFVFRFIFVFDMFFFSISVSVCVAVQNFIVTYVGSVFAEMCILCTCGKKCTLGCLGACFLVNFLHAYWPIGVCTLSQILWVVAKWPSSINNIQRYKLANEPACQLDCDSNAYNYHMW